MNNFFGFSESRSNTSVLNSKPTSGHNGLYNTFRCDKPYRLAFYWQPSNKRRRLDALNVTRSTIQKSPNESLTITHNISLEKSNVSNKAEVTKPIKRKNNTKINNKENEGRNDNNTRANTKKKGATLFEGENAPTVEIRQSGRLRELNGKKSTNAEKSAVKLTDNEPVFKENENDLFDAKKKACVTFTRKRKAKEPTAAETTVECNETVEVKKRPSITYTRNKSKPKEPARTKQKDTTKTKNKMPKAEEIEFEKWAASLNKEFDEVENFDLSVNYD